MHIGTNMSDVTPARLLGRWRQ